MLALLVLDSKTAAAGRFTLPLASADLPDGVLTVKVVGSDMRDRKVGVPVRLERLQGERAESVSTVKTGDDGRARFEGLKPSEQYVVTVTAEGKHRSEPLPGPKRGGIRLLLTLGAGGVPVSGAPPPGHPPTGGATPAGHPPTGAPSPGHPPTGRAGQAAKEHDQGGAATVEAAPDLPANQLQVVVLRGKARKPLSKALVKLSSEGAKALELGPTDAEGKTSATVDPSRRYRVTIDHQGLTYRSRSVAPPKEGGLKVTFQVFDRSGAVDRLSLGKGTHWVSQIGEGVVRFMQVMELSNDTDTVIDPRIKHGKSGLSFPLPETARKVELPAELRGILVVDAENKRLRLVAPIPPGGLPLRAYFEVPFQGAELDLRQIIPVAQVESALVVLNNDRIKVSGPTVTGAGQKNTGGKGMVFPLDAVEAGGAAEVTFTGLPHRDRRPLQATLAIAALVALWGLLAALGGPRRARKRQERRKLLLEQVTTLRRHKSRKQQEKQEVLLRELRQVWEDEW